MCCVVGQDTNSHSGKINAGGTPVMDLYPIQGGVEYSLSLHAS